MIYAHDVLGDLQHWAVGWVDWNAVLDLSGGPNHAHNYVDATFICDTANTTICYKNPMYV
jgi:glucosylceramidase